jgi:AraC family transcriptional regulator of adaptative response/methylated-DNA-[protein]-cysteine methyltransferase
MTSPNRYSPAAGSVIRYAHGTCSLGAALLASTEHGVCAILLGDDPGALIGELQHNFPETGLIAADAECEQLLSQVLAFIESPGSGLELALDIRGTEFQRRVWKALQEIPPGSTASYTEVATRIGAPKAVRAVAQACAANLLAIAIPCHRVVRNNGALSGYRGGVARKRALLEREARLTVSSSPISAYPRQLYPDLIWHAQTIQHF